MTLERYPGGPLLPRAAGPIIDLDTLRNEQLMNPDRFDVEFGGRWRTSMAAYLPAEDIDVMFGGYRGMHLPMRPHGIAQISYHAHADPSLVGANFAVVVAHIEPSDDHVQVPYMIVDSIESIRPDSYADGRIDYVDVAHRLMELTDDFDIAELTFDHWNSAGLIDQLNNYVRERHRYTSTRIHEVQPTARLNLEMAENFKTALALHRVRAPKHELAELELRYLQYIKGKVGPPDGGSVRTSDIVDCLFNLGHRLLGSHLEQQLSGFTPDVARVEWGRPTSDPNVAALFAQARAGSRRMTHAQKRSAAPARTPKITPQ